MIENTNKAILFNSLILYIRLVIIAISGLLTTRYALLALGVDDFGIFSVVGSIVSFIAIINTIMLSTSNRFIAVAIGKKNEKLINETFNVNLVIHVLIAVFTLFVAIPLGEWYIGNYINYVGNIYNVVLVYRITVVGAVLSFIGVPYNGLLVAKERFLIYCTTDIFSSILKAVVAYSLVNNFSDKLLVYAIAISFTTAFPTLVFYLYCLKTFPSYVRFKIVKDSVIYKEIFNFSLWVGYGAIASVGKSQGSALIINNFFNTALNTALGVANSVNSLVLLFARNIGSSISPQIVKSFAVGDIKRCEKLVIMSSKYSFLVLLMVSTPFLVAPEYIFSIWLGDVPTYVIPFTYLMIVDALIGVLNAGVPDLVFATGRIKWYQIIENTILLLSVLVGYLVLQYGFSAYYLLVTYIFFSVIVLVIRQVLLNRLVKFNNWRLVKESYIPCIVISLLFSLVLLLKLLLPVFVVLCLGMLYLLILCLVIGLTKDEKAYLSCLFTRLKK